MAKKSKVKKYYYIQSWGTYASDTLVFVGYDFNGILKVLKKYKQDGFIEFLKNDTSLKTNISNNNYKGYAIGYNTKSILLLKEYKNDWKCFDIILHEIHHLVYIILGQERDMKNEMEAQAYQFEYLFKNIRQKLNKVFDK